MRLFIQGVFILQIANLFPAILSRSVTRHALELFAASRLPGQVVHDEDGFHLAVKIGAAVLS